MSDFKVGDRVMYTAEMWSSLSNDRRRVGRRAGTVKSLYKPDRNYLNVQWDGVKTPALIAVAGLCLEKDVTKFIFRAPVLEDAPELLKVGDLVRFKRLNGPAMLLASIEYQEDATHQCLVVWHDVKQALRISSTPSTLLEKVQP